MAIIFCNNCGERILIMEHVGDYVHECNSGIESIDNEDILHHHVQFTEFGVTTEGKKPFEANMSGMDNKLAGTDAALEGQKVHDLTSRGNPKSLYRTRQRYQYIELDKE